MEYLQSIILGIVEGATEYLPISSTWHLIQVTRLLGIPASDFQKAYEVIIQSGAILAVIFLYWSTILTDWGTIKKVFISFVPTAIVGLTLYKIIKNFFFENLLLQMLVFVVVGVIFILWEKWQKQDRLQKTLAGISWQGAIFVGLAQAVAIVPGVSRSGAVILTLMFLGVRRDQAAKYSFLLAVPTLMAASGLDLYKSLPVLTGNLDRVGYLAVGFVAAFVSALVVIKWFIGFLERHDLAPFGWYRIILGGILLSLVLLNYA